MNVAQRHPEMYALARANAAAEGRYLPHPSQLSGPPTPTAVNLTACREIAKVINKIYLANYGGNAAGFATGRYLANMYKGNATFFNEAGTYIVSYLAHIATLGLAGPRGTFTKHDDYIAAMNECLKDESILAALKEENKALFYNIYANKLFEYSAIAYSAYKGYQKGDIASAIGYAIGARFNPAGMVGMASTIDK